MGYQAGEVGVADLVAEVPGLAAFTLEAHQLAQLDSKDMDVPTWQRLAQAVLSHVQREDVTGVVITHGTDTLEETAYFLHRVLPQSKPVVLTAAMRPTTALLRDGPQNLLDAVRLAALPGAQGVLVLLAGQVHAAHAVRKVHSYAVAAFASPESGPLALMEEGAVRQLHAWPQQAEAPLALRAWMKDVQQWPRVEIVLNHVGADGRLVDALLAQGVVGLVVAGTGNGTVSTGLAQALDRAQAQGVAVLRSTRCDAGAVVGEGRWPHAGSLGPVKARIALQLELLQR
ncbi:asparaginase [Roseateles sp. BYS180W]|uniref:Asparaginase n=1 Tax=Roseateles rivi TaxID=3299028 RepID=A0ABW7FXZ6_9BURK